MNLTMDTVMSTLYLVIVVYMQIVLDSDAYDIFRNDRVFLTVSLSWKSMPWSDLSLSESYTCD